MSWNNGLERKKFEAEWKRREAEFRAAGLSEDQIQHFREFEEEVFLSDRRYYTHTQPFSSSDFDDEDDNQEDKSTLYENFLENLTETPVYTLGTRYSWIEEIENEELAKKLESLTDVDKEILTLLAMEEKSQKEISDEMNIPYRTIKYKIHRLKNFLKNF